MKKLTLIVLMLFTLLSNQVLSQVENEQYQAILHYEIIDNNQSEALDTGDVINFILTATNTGNVGGDGGAYNYTFNDFDANQITLSNNSFVNAYQLEVGEQVESSAWYSISEQSLSSGGVELEVDLFFGGYYFQSNKLRVIFNEELSADILLNGTVSAENNQIKNVADPTDAQDAATKSYIDALMANLQTPSNIPTDGLVAYYPFNGNANDESGNGNHGTATDATLTYDRFDNENSAYSFDGDGDYIVSTSNVGVGQTTLTFSFWAKTEYGSKRMAALSQDCGTDCDNAFGLVLNKFLNSAVVCDDGHMGTSPQSFGYAQPSHYATVRTTTANNGWNNYVLIVGADGDYSFNNFRFYVNGIEQITNCDHNWGNSQWQFNFPDYRLMIGNKPNSIEGYFHGEIDDVAIWNRALTIEEINTTFGATETENNIQNIEQVLTQGNDANGIQLKGIADPTEAQDAATKNYAETQFYSQSEVDALIANLQNQIDDLDSDNDYGCSPFTVLVYGTQEWSGVNACNITYRDGTPIPQVTEYDEWAALTTGAWAYYDNDPTKPRLYNWYAVMGIYDEASLLDASLRKEFAPEGWHVPSDAEWTTLENYLITNGYNYDGSTLDEKIAKAIASSNDWNTSNTIGAVGYEQNTNNSSEFSAYPNGLREAYGAFNFIGRSSVFWTSTQLNSNNARNRDIYYNRGYIINYSALLNYGFSVRFVRD